MSVSRTAVVTGANKGIGFHIAKQITESGLFTTVVLACRDRARGEEARQALRTSLAAARQAAAPATPAIELLLLDVGDASTHEKFVKEYTDRFGSKCHCLVNNAAIAFKQADPTPFAGQTAPTLKTNFYGTVAFTEQMLPLLTRAGQEDHDARIVNVASMAGHLAHNVKDAKKVQEFRSPTLTIQRVKELANEFQEDVQSGTWQQRGWGNSNYGMSKCCLIAATNVWARELAEKNIKANSCCPGYCKTDMSSNRGGQPAEVGARNASLLACTNNCPTGVFVREEAIAEW